jgi:translation elongation factor EF-G
MPYLEDFGVQAGDARLTDTRADEQERCITIKSTGVVMSMYMCIACWCAMLMHMCIAIPQHISEMDFSP